MRRGDPLNVITDRHVKQLVRKLMIEHGVVPKLTSKGHVKLSSAKGDFLAVLAGSAPGRTSINKLRSIERNLAKEQ